MPSLPTVTVLLELFAAQPYLILLLVLGLEEAGLPLPLPGDLLILLAGAAVAAGRLELLPAALCIVVAATLGSSALYGLGRLGGRQVLARHGERLGLEPARLASLEGWLAERPAAVVWSRLVPGLRIVTSFAAGSLRLPWPAYLAATTLSAALWAAIYLTLGALLGPALGELGGALDLPAPAWPLLALVALALLAVAHLRRQRRPAP